jgi:hypothetical protein
MQSAPMRQPWLRNNLHWQWSALKSLPRPQMSQQ